MNNKRDMGLNNKRVQKICNYLDICIRIIKEKGNTDY